MISSKAAVLAATWFLPDAMAFGVLNRRPSPIRTPGSGWGLNMAGEGDIPPGWEGGFMESNPSFAYPDPDLSSLQVKHNMANIGKLTRMQQIKWPQFSWLSEPPREKSRVYQRFAEDISRVGYDDTGRVWSIICPQQGFYTNYFGGLNVEVTVTGNRGWVVEPKPDDIYAEMSVVGKIWFNPPSRELSLLRWIEEYLDHDNFPFSKEHALVVYTHNPGDDRQPLFNLTKGVDPNFVHPDFTTHDDEAYGVAHLNVEIGPIFKTNKPAIDRFNQLVLDLFNLASGNILRDGSILSWNVWFESPELVDRVEWSHHAEKWRHSLQVDHCPPPPLDPGTSPQYADGTPFNAFTALLQAEEHKLIHGYLDTLKDSKIKELCKTELNALARASGLSI